MSLPFSLRAALSYHVFPSLLQVSVNPDNFQTILNWNIFFNLCKYFFLFLLFLLSDMLFFFCLGISCLFILIFFLLIDVLFLFLLFLSRNISSCFFLLILLSCFQWVLVCTTRPTIWTHILNSKYSTKFIKQHFDLWNCCLYLALSAGLKSLKYYSSCQK